MAPTAVIFIEPRENSQHLGGCPRGQLDGKGAGLDALPNPLLLHPHPFGPRSCSEADRRGLVVSFTNSFLFGNGFTQALQVIEQDRKGSILFLRISKIPRSYQETIKGLHLMRNYWGWKYVLRVHVGHALLWLMIFPCATGYSSINFLTDSFVFSWDPWVLWRGVWVEL